MGLGTWDFGLADATSPSAPTSARTAPTSTVSPSLTFISSSLPAAGEGTSASTLSVEISSSGSSFSIVSPTALSHFETVPSVIDSPICGMTISSDLGFGISDLGFAADANDAEGALDLSGSVVKMPAAGGSAGALL